MLLVEVHTTEVLVDIADGINVEPMTIEVPEPEVLQAQVEYQPRVGICLVRLRVEISSCELFFVGA